MLITGLLCSAFFIVPMSKTLTHSLVMFLLLTFFIQECVKVLTIFLRKCVQSTRAARAGCCGLSRHRMSPSRHSEVEGRAKGCCLSSGYLPKPGEEHISGILSVYAISFCRKRLLDVQMAS